MPIRGSGPTPRGSFPLLLACCILTCYLCVFSLPELAVRIGRVRTPCVGRCLPVAVACGSCLVNTYGVSGPVCVLARLPVCSQHVCCLSLRAAPSAHSSPLPTGAHQAGWVSGASWKTPATRAPVLGVGSARAPWWLALPDSPAGAPVGSEARTAPCRTPASAAPVPMVPAAPWGPTGALCAPARRATRVAAAEATWMSVGWAGHAATGAPASTHRVPSAASALVATRGCCVRSPQCPVPRRRAAMEAPVGRVAILLMTAPVSLGSRARTVK